MKKKMFKKVMAASLAATMTALQDVGEVLLLLRHRQQIPLQVKRLQTMRQQKQLRQR